MTSSPFSSRGYRPEIDGLRAIAVLAVILFHINPQWLPGGFVGVDIFFVISGYLITGIVAKELHEGRFTFKRFYERRIRRILPALWALLLIGVPVSWWLMLPEDAEAMGKSALWSTLAMANVYFWREVSTDYFAPQSAQLPFLHLWSLGVEEQFYLVWPVLLLLVLRFARRRAFAIACTLALFLVLASTLLAEWLLATRQARFAYYMLPPRAGELALGAALALALANPSFANPLGRHLGSAAAARIAAVAGWSLLACSLATLSEHGPFPGWRTLPPILGCAALILAGHLAPAEKWLAPLRCSAALWLGRCSYSAYLWHWPLLAWWRYLWGQPSAIEGLLLLVSTLLLARASQRWVEDPIRKSRTSFSRTLGLYGIAPTLLIGTLALLVARGERWNLPLYSPSDRSRWAELETYTRPAHRHPWVCQQHVLDPASLTAAECEFGAGTEPAQILLLGDSHAAEFAPILRIAAETQQLRMRSVALGACAPLTGSLQGMVAENRLAACEQGMEQVWARARDFELLIVGAAWDNYARNSPQVWARLESQLTALVAQGHRVLLLPRVPQFADYDAACPAKRLRVGNWLHCPTELVPSDTGDDANARLAAMAKRVPGVLFLPLHEALCSGGRCPVTDPQGHNLYADPAHLSVHGSQHLAAELQRTNRMPNLLSPSRFEKKVRIK